MGDAGIVVEALHIGLASRLHEERYVVVFPPGHGLGALSAITLNDLSGEPYIDRLACEMREMVAGVCEDKGIELYARFRSEREDWVSAMVRAAHRFPWPG